MNKKFIVRLTQEEREDLKRLVTKGKAAAFKIRHANILLKTDADGPNWTDEQTAIAFSVHRLTVRDVRQRFVEKGLEAALERKKRAKPATEKLLDGANEARLIALACSTPPEGRNRWTLRLLADQVVELNIVESISYETVRLTLKKTH